MNLSTGTRLGPYEILAPLGAGGMGEVYRARDTRLGRDVAIKALPAEFATDAERLARFEREAKLLASLSHPNIAGIHGLEDAGGTRYLVLEFVEGETLAERLSRGPLSVDDALGVCAQVAAALEAAHEAGIIHRDLKPGNVMIKPDGSVKVLDFGLAKAGAAGASSSDPHLSASPTLSHMATSAGVILGTAAYMSPEQARGKAVDRRTDIWSFGCVLFECLAGKPLFDGDTVSDLIAKILQTDPDWSALPASTPARVRELLARCLTRDASRRLRDIGEARIALTDVLSGAADAGPAAPAPLPARRRRGVSWLGAALLIVLAAVVVIKMLQRTPAPRPVVLSVMLPKTEQLSAVGESDPLALSPDGQQIAYTATSGKGEQQLFLRPLDRPDAVAIPGTDDARDPFFSPDGEWIAFFTSKHLYKVSVHGGSPIALADAETDRGGTWLDDGTIVYTPTYGSPLFRVGANGDKPRAITVLDSTRQERTHRWPSPLPGGEWVVFTVGVTNSPGGYDDASIGAVSLRTGERRVLARGRCASYAPGKRLIIAREGSLYSIPIDPDDPRGGATPVPVVDGVLGVKTSGASFFGIARDGTLAMVPGAEQRPESRLAWMDMAGHVTYLPGAPRDYSYIRMSPDGKKALVVIGRGGGGDANIYRLDLARGTMGQVTFASAESNWSPLWLPDGRHMVWQRTGGIGSEMVTRSVLGGDSVRVLTQSKRPLIPSTIGPGGKTVLYSEYGAVDSDILEVPLAGGPVRRVVHEPGAQTQPSVSPDGRWIAYGSSVNSQQIFIQPLGGDGGRVQISTDGGNWLMWGPDSRRLYYTDPSGLVEAFLSEHAGVLAADSTRTLFAFPFSATDSSVRRMDIDPSGKRFLVILQAGGENEMREISVRLNWASALSSSDP